ncbi:MAG TPA: outer membrane beta-barrel protein [Bacteroidota bacterium]|nr:outer membrane beta-barrel protein [Bacteroidota bacterium]
MSASFRVLRAAAICALIFNAGEPLAAQDIPVKPAAEAPHLPLIDLNQSVAFEVAPHTGMMGGSGTFGLNLLMTYSSFSLELAGEQVIGKTANLYPISLNAVLNLATHGRLIPYGAVGAGLFMTVPVNALGAETVSTLGLNFGGGARYFITRAFGVRLEAKQYFTSISNTRGLKNDLLFFQEVSVGATFLFH